MARVCLAGPGITSDRAVVEALRTGHDVELVADQAGLECSRSIDRADVLVLDAAGIRPSLERLLRSIRARRPGLPVVLVDGGLTDDDKVNAFELGVLDYFPAPCHAGLLAERLGILARATR